LKSNLKKIEKKWNEAQELAKWANEKMTDCKTTQELLSFYAELSAKKEEWNKLGGDWDKLGADGFMKCRSDINGYPFMKRSVSISSEEEKNLEELSEMASHLHGQAETGASMPMSVEDYRKQLVDGKFDMAMRSLARRDMPMSVEDYRKQEWGPHMKMVNRILGLDPSLASPLNTSNDVLKEANGWKNWKYERRNKQTDNLWYKVTTSQEKWDNESEEEGPQDGKVGVTISAEEEGPQDGEVGVTISEAQVSDAKACCCCGTLILASLLACVILILVLVLDNTWLTSAPWRSR